MTRARVRTSLALCLAASAAAIGCSRPESRYESVVQVVRVQPLERDKDGKPTQVDLELEWDACPGDQYQVVRGGKELAACTASVKVGDYVPVVVRHFWDPHGFYRWDLERIGDCARDVEPASFGSYEKSQDCKDVVNHGRVVGFDCSRRPFPELLARCPWMARD